jgi:hypothetical protein
MKFLSTTAGGYTVLIAVGVVGFLVLHQVLKKDVTDSADALKHPFGQAFDDWFNSLVGGPTTPSAPAPLAPNFGLTDPNSSSWSN